MVRVRQGVAAVALALSWTSCALAQSAVMLTEPKTPLLPASFGEWHTASGSQAAGSTFSLSTVNKTALEECGPQRSAVHDYSQGGRTLHVEAIEFGDRTGAESAFTLVARPEMKTGMALGDQDAAGDGAVLFRTQATLVLATPATAADIASLASLSAVLPKAFGNKGVAPLLPRLAPKENLVPGSLRYALGPETYAAEGGVLPAQSVEWDKSAEAITAAYAGKGGSETLTIASYPTPEIAGAVSRRVQGVVAGLGPQFAAARVRREKLLLVLASGPWAASDAQKLIDGVHLNEQLSIDKGPPPPDFNVEVHKTVSLLVAVCIFSGALMLIALVLAIFLGGGRALLRVMRGKPAAVEPEFLSLHLATQNAPVRFQPEDSGR